MVMLVWYLYSVAIGLPLVFDIVDHRKE